MSETMKASVLKDKNGAEVHLMDERLPQVTEADNGMPLYVENGEYKVGKVQKNAVQGLVTDFINIYGLFDAKDAAIAEKADKVHTHAFSEITDKPSTFLTEADKQDIVNDTLSALAGADTSDATIAELQGRWETHNIKIRNMAEDIGTLQAEVDELELNFVEYTIKMLYRIIRLERHLGLQPPVIQDGDSMETVLDASYDDVPWAE